MKPIFLGVSEMTHRGSWKATGAGCGEQWPHTACWEPQGPALSNRKCVSSPLGGWRYAGDAPYGENMLLDLFWHSWYLLLPWGCLWDQREKAREKKERNHGSANSHCTASFLWNLELRDTFYTLIFMSLPRLPLTHRRDVTILFLPWLPSMHHIHPSPLNGCGSLQHCRQSSLIISKLIK